MFVPSNSLETTAISAVLVLSCIFITASSWYVLSSIKDMFVIAESGWNGHLNSLEVTLQMGRENKLLQQQ